MSADKLFDVFSNYLTGGDGLEDIRQNPDTIFHKAGMSPDPWQQDLLRSNHPLIAVCVARQCGKTQVTSAVVLKTALLEPGTLSLIIAPSLRQSVDFLQQKLAPLWRSLGCPLKSSTPPSQTKLVLSNGSTILAMPGEEQTIRGISKVSLLVVDEAARVPDTLFHAVSPMVQMANGRIIMLSTPWGMRGVFWQIWSKEPDWKKIMIQATDCPRWTPEALARERRMKGERFYRQEFACSFESAVGQFFDPDDVFSAVNKGGRPLFAGGIA